MSTILDAQTSVLSKRTKSFIISTSKNSFKKSEAKTINYRDEVILYFYNELLNQFVKSIDACEENEMVSIPSHESEKKSYRNLVEEDLINTSIVSVHGADVLLTSNTSELDKHLIKKYSVTIEDTSNSTGLESLVKQSRKSKKSIRKSLKTQTARRSKTLSILEPRSIILEESESRISLVLSSLTPHWFVRDTESKLRITFLDGSSYDGDVCKKIFCGNGVFLWADGTRYKGEFNDGCVTGKGLIHYSDMTWYQGEFVNGLRNGFGSLFKSNSTQVYSGEWSFSKRHGVGWMLWAPGDWYDGHWANDTMEGLGIRRYASGNMYHGNWKNGRRHGFGCFVWTNNDFYIGNWNEGKREGFGKYVWKTFFNNSFAFPIENYYFGTWQNDYMEGLGIMDFGTEGGAKYAGYFNQNQKHGLGGIVCENGMIIERNPLFLNDKPVHLKENSNTSVEKKSENENENSGKVSLILPELEAPIVSTCLEGHTSNQNQNVTQRSSIYQMVSQYLLSKESLSEVENSLTSVKKSYNAFFPTVAEQFISFPVPLNTADHLISLNFYIEKLKKMVETIKEKDFFQKTNSYDRSYILFYQDIKSYEEKWLRKSIIHYLPKLRNIYHLYASVACIEPAPFKPVMVKLFLWQLYRDLELPKLGISLVKCDQLIAENLDSGIENLHDPFEVIHFWQFLHSLLVIAFQLYGKYWMEFVKCGVLKGVFSKFLDEVVLPNYGQHKGSVLFEYRDLLPIRSVYQLYKNLGEPHTVVHLLRNCCTPDGTDPEDFHKVPNDVPTLFVNSGTNICMAGYSIVYIKDQEPIIFATPAEEKEKIPDTDPYRTSLYMLRNLGANKLMNIIGSICPGVVEEHAIMNSIYPLSFIEFYEILLMAAQELLNQKNVQDTEPELDQVETVVSQEIVSEAVSNLTMKENKSVDLKLKKKRKK